jgi:hypothetical protein
MQVGQPRWWRAACQGIDRLPLVEHEGVDEHERSHVGRIRSELARHRATMASRSRDDLHITIKPTIDRHSYS